MQDKTFARRAVLAAAAVAAVAGVAPSAFAQAAWPSKPLKIIVPYTPGGSSDIIARIISPMLGEALKQTVIVENKPGASGNMGADQTSKANDGYTIMLCDVSALAISPSLYTKLNFDPSKDLKGVAMLAYSPHMLVVHPSVPANNLKELVELSKKSKIDFAVTAMGSAPHLAGFQVASLTGAKWEYIPYKGGSQAVTDTIAGQTQVLMNGMLATLPFVQQNKLKVIGVSKSTRVPLLPNVPTLAEQGATGFESGTWQGILAPANMPKANIDKLSAALITIIRSPEVRARLAAQGAEVSTMNPAEMDTFFNAERKKWAAVVAKSGLKLD
jgi:tripartite-type tricarboxylate transporter receptor subunit TctC